MKQSNQWLWIVVAILFGAAATGLSIYTYAVQAQQLSQVQAQLNEAQKAQAQLQSSLNQAQLQDTKQVLASTQTKLQTAEQTAADLKARLDLITLPTPVASPVVKISGGLYYELTSIPISVDTLDEVRGEIICSGAPCAVYIQDPAGKTVQDFGQVSQTNFRFVAPLYGRYSLVVKDTYTTNLSYSVTYVIYKPYKR